MTLIKSTKFLDFKSAKSPSGNDWYYVKRTNDRENTDSAVVITTLVNINGEYNFLFIKTKRPPIYAENKAKYCLESPAGLIGDINKDEDLLECAKKELLEEAGHTADKLYIELTNSSTSAGLSSETLSYVTAIVLNNKLKSTPIDDGGVICERFYVKAAEIYDYINSIKKDEISIAAPTICGVFYALKRLNSLTNTIL